MLPYQANGPQRHAPDMLQFACTSCAPHLVHILLSHPDREALVVQDGLKHRLDIIHDDDWDAAVQHSILSTGRPTITWGRGQGRDLGVLIEEREERESSNTLLMLEWSHGWRDNGMRSARLHECHPASSCAYGSMVPTGTQVCAGMYCIQTTTCPFLSCPVLSVHICMLFTFAVLSAQVCSCEHQHVSGCLCVCLCVRMCLHS